MGGNFDRSFIVKHAVQELYYDGFSEFLTRCYIITSKQITLHIHRTLLGARQQVTLDFQSPLLGASQQVTLDFQSPLIV